jgi:Ca-activated chloride channel family protein
MSLIGVSMSSLPSISRPELCPARDNLTMKNCKPSSILTNTLQCLAASIITGAICACVLVVIVLLLSGPAAAYTGDNNTGDDMLRVERPADVMQGTLLFRDEQDYSMAPLLKTAVAIEVTGMIARATVKQHFRNPDDTWKEGIYVFPLPENAAVDHLLMHIGARVIEGRIQERQEARRQYEQARTEGRKASLIEQERPNIFTTSVANIGPHEEITIEIKYQHIVPFDSGNFRLRFPMVVAPRYIPGVPVGPVEVPEFSGNGWAVNTDEVMDASRITPPVIHPDRGAINPVQIHINLEAGFPLQHIDSSYHNIAVKQNSKSSYAINLDSGETPADRDFELVWSPEPGRMPRAAFFSEQKDSKNYALIMLLPPQQAVAAILPREVIFVIDTSGSMAGTSITQARAALELALDDLRPGDRFNIIQFNSYMEQLFKFPHAVDAESLRAAKKYVGTLTAQGGTEMAPALNAALDQTAEGSMVRQIIFLTDGSIGNEEALFEIIKHKLGTSRLFTVGIGSAPNSHFMSGAASFGRGTYTYIGKISEVQEKMQALFEKLKHPVLTDLHIEWEDARDIEAWPQKLPDLYTGEPLLLTASATNLPGTLRITGRSAGRDWHSNLTLQGGGRENGIAVLWARTKIKALMDQLTSGADNTAIRKTIIDTAMEHHLVSKFTSLVAIDVTPTRVRDEILKSAAVPVNLPAGWDYEKVFGPMPRTATNAELHLFIGIILIMLGLLQAMFLDRREYRHAR